MRNQRTSDRSDEATAQTVVRFIVRRLVPVALLLLLESASVAAQTLQSAEQNPDTSRSKLNSPKVSEDERNKAMLQARSVCEPRSVQWHSPAMPGVPWSEASDQVYRTHSWSGGCVEGRRDGSGVLVELFEHYELPGRQLTMKNVWKTEGTFVKGELAGLACFQTFEEKLPGRDSMFALGKDVPPGTLVPRGAPTMCSVTGAGLQSSVYVKQSDGSWAYVLANANTELRLPPGSLEQESDRIIAAARRGEKSLKPQSILLQDPLLADLLPGGKFRFQLVPEKVVLASKRLALIPSTRMNDELVRFRRERQALIERSAAVYERPPAPGTYASEYESAKSERTKFINASRPENLLTAIVAALRRKGADVIVESDLTVLSSGKYDYALVVDWRSLTRLDLFDSYGSLNEDAKLTGQLLSSYLLNKQAEVIRYSPARAEQQLTRTLCDSGKDGRGCDNSYFRGLNTEFQLWTGAHGNQSIVQITVETWFP